MLKRVLIVDVDRELSSTLETALREREIDASSASPAEAQARLADGRYGVVLVDLDPEGSGNLCAEIHLNHPSAFVIVMTGHASLDAAISAIRAGAHDFVTKPFAMDQIALSVESALRHADLRDELVRLRHVLSTGDLEMLGESPAIAHVLDVVQRVARSDTAVLIAGESGTGKELVARALHVRSGRTGPFVPVNCAAMTETLLETELFGHVKGAFTDARAGRFGLFVKAAQGTLFLDEIGEMTAGMQAKLLRVLQEHRVRPVGSDAEVEVDARILAATHRNLEDEVEEHRFREDLFYRINVVRIDVPPLRARGRDILLLAQRFLERYAASMGRAVIGMTTAAAERMLAYTWPGNIRELQNCIERAVALAQFDKLGTADLPEKLLLDEPAAVPMDVMDPHELLPMDEVERRYTLRVLDEVHGNKRHAARILGYDRRTLERRLRRWTKPEPRPTLEVALEPRIDGPLDPALPAQAEQAIIE